MRSYAAAVAFAEHEHQTPSANVRKGGMCQWFARNCVGAGPFGLTAIAAWKSVPASWRRTGAPPPGSLPYWSGGSRGFGHAAFAVGGHEVWSTDIERTGHVDLVPYTQIERDWGLHYLGYLVRTPSGALPVQAAEPVFHLKDLRYGVRGSASVKKLQRRLNAQEGAQLPVTGNYLDLTDRAVRRCQLAHGFGSDPVGESYVGPKQAKHLKLT